MPSSSFGRLLRASLLLSVSCLCLSALPLLAAKGCSLPKSWSSPVYPNASLTFPLLMPNDLTNSSECQVLAYNTSLLPADPSTHIVGYDVATGKQKWRYLLSDGKNGRDWEILPAYSTTGPYDHIFQTTWKYNGCGKGPNDLLLNITRLSYDRNHGLKRVWTISLGCDPFGYVQTFVFPASAKRPELLLVVGIVEWLTVDAHTGAALNRQPAPFGEITIMGDSSAHQFVAIVRDDDTHSSIISYQLSTDGMWQQLAVTQYDSYTYREMEVNAYGIEYASRGVVLVLQQYPQYDQLIGINALTGKQQWSASNYPLLDGSWVDAHPEFIFGGASLEPHPLRSEYVIISSSGYNSSTREAIFAFGLLDSMTGNVIATSPATQVQYHEAGGFDEIIGEWQTVDNGGILIRRMHSFSYSTDFQYWVALNSTTLKIISQGTLPTLPNVDAFSGVIAVDAQRGEFSFVATMNTIVYDPVTVGGATIVGQRIKATNGEDRTENPTDRHRHARLPALLRSLASKA